MKFVPTQEQIRIMKHALGLKRGSVEPYRNYYLAGPGHSDEADLQILVEEKLMYIVPTSERVSFDDTMYMVNNEGKALCRR